MGCETCRTLLSEGLDLCVRARKMDAIERTNATLSASSDPQKWVESGMYEKYAEVHNRHNQDTPILTRSATMPLWLMEQYDTDLADWERRGRAHLLNGCTKLLSPLHPERE